MARIAEIIDELVLIKYDRTIDNYFFMIDQGMQHIYRGLNQGYDNFMREWTTWFIIRRLFNDRNKNKWDIQTISNSLFNDELRG